MPVDSFEALIWFVLFLPLAGSVLQALFGKAVVRRFGEATGKKIMGYAGVLPVAIGFAFSAAVTWTLMQVPADSRSLAPLTLFEWIDLASIRMPFEVLVDPLSMTMALIITGVGALIHVYATGYMAEDRDYTRFFTYFNLFIAFMLILVLGNNLGMLFIGWEGVGLCSYLLIGFWFQDIANAKAANKAFIVNRIGDWGLTLGMFLLLAALAGHATGGVGADARWLSYDVFLPRIPELFRDQPALATTVALLFFMGACGKSAQFPLHFWLPDAMAGPTPVSALIHAATMVTAGVFLLNRLYVVFALSPLAMAIVAAVGAFTALFAALVAFGQTDIKRVLAYSTVSQLGFMFTACGVGAFWAGIFHVATHAFFKALLFLGSGAVIYAMAHEQDMRRYGHLFKYLKITGLTMLIAWLAISGIWPLAGFYSKESILASALGNSLAVVGDFHVGVAAGWVLLIVAALTAAYMTRMTVLTFGLPGTKPEERWRSLPVPDNHEAHSQGHEPHEGHEAHDDPHGFFLTDEQASARFAEAELHHHALAPDHEPKEPPPSLWVPLVILAALCVVGGFVLMPFLKDWLYPAGIGVDPSLVSGHPHGWVGQWLVLLSIFAAISGIAYGWLAYRGGLPASEREESTWHPFRRAARDQFGYDGLVMQAGVEGGASVGNFLWKKVDAGFVDGFFNASAWITGQIGKGLRVLQTGYVRSYALLMLVGAVAIFVYLLYATRALAGGGS